MDIMEVRRVRLGKLFEQMGFDLRHPTQKAYEFVGKNGQFIYFYWDQGEDINIAINPSLDYTRLIGVGGAKLKAKNKPDGIRFGAAMREFPDQYEGFKPADSGSRVGRMFAIPETGIADFLTGLKLISSAKKIVQPAEVTDGESESGQCYGVIEKTASEELSEEISAHDRVDQEYESDPLIRSLVEKCAVKVAVNYYNSLGYQVQELGKPYDLLCQKNDQVVHVEVKGSRSKLKSVTLTGNEIVDARNNDWQSDLFVVDRIVIEQDASGQMVSRAGEARVMRNWKPVDSDLAAIEYKYVLPASSTWKYID